MRSLTLIKYCKLVKEPLCKLMKGASSQTERRPRSEAKEGHSFVYVSNISVSDAIVLVKLTCSRRVYYIFSGPPCGINFRENSDNKCGPLLCQINDVRTTK